MPKKLQYEDVKKFIELESNSCCKLISEEYIDKRCKLTILCKCGNEFITDFDSFKYKNKRQCNKCGRVPYNKLEYDDVKQFIEDNGYELLSDKYVKSIEKLQLKCPNGHIFYMSHNSFKVGHRCSICNDVQLYRTIESFRDEILKKTNGEYEVVGEYINNSTKIDFKHNTCGNIFKTSPNSILQGHGCPLCNHRSYIKTTEEFRKEIYELVGNEYTILGEYIKNSEKILIRHNICNHEYEVTPINLIKGRRCPTCKESKGEQEVRHILQKLNQIFETQYSFKNLQSDKGNQLIFDFIVFTDKSKEKIKYLIEYDGEFHYEPIISQQALELQQYHDKLKDEYCERNSLKLIRIPHWEFNNIENILKRLE